MVRIRPWLPVLDRWPTVKACLTLLEYLSAAPAAVAYDQQLDRIVDEHFKGPAVPPILYHYTSIEAFKGIVTSRLIWAMSHRSMNDQSELRAIDSVIERVVADLTGEITGPARYMLALFADNHPTRRIADEVEIGLRCFTAEPDSRPHWDKFAPAGEGVCIAFQMIAGETHPALLDGHIGTGLYPVEYSGSVWERRLKKGFMAVLDAYNAYANGGGPRSERLVDRRTVVALAQIAALASIAAKRWDLRDEREWRHVLYPASDAPVDWKTTEAGRRYLALPARAEGKLLLLDRVIVRSTAPENDVRKVITILEAAGYPSEDVPMPEVTISSYPLKARAA